MTEPDDTTTSTPDDEHPAAVVSVALRDTRVLVLALWALTLIGWTLGLVIVTPERLDDGEPPPSTTTTSVVAEPEPLTLSCAWTGEVNESDWVCERELPPTTTTEGKG